MPVRCTSSPSSILIRVLFWPETPSEPISAAAWPSWTSIAGLEPSPPTAIEFLGRHGSLAAPAALGRTGLSGRVGAGIDPCAAIQAKFELGPGETTEIVFQIGEADSVEAVRALVRRYWDADSTAKAVQDSKSAWDDVLDAVVVSTPDPALDLLLNRWLLYQVRSCRLWARSAFYQSGGAYGFRDQLQDVMALLHAAPAEARGPDLRSAARQFLEGDVQHWWHPPVGRGVRTRISDDLLWLPYVTSVYVETTGDSSILDEQVPYLKGPVLKPGEDDEFGRASRRRRIRHAVRSLHPRSGARAAAGRSRPSLDGQRRLERRHEPRGRRWQGRERLAGLVPDCLLARVCRSCGGSRRTHPGQPATMSRPPPWSERSRIMPGMASWYLRAFFDDGTPLGSARNSECQIDSIAQSWGVLSAAADPERSRQAMSRSRSGSFDPTIS